jgi:hypothetical protein
MTAENGFAGGEPVFKRLQNYEIITRPVGYF